MEHTENSLIPYELVGRTLQRVVMPTLSSNLFYRTRQANGYGFARSFAYTVPVSASLPPDRLSILKYAPFKFAVVIKPII